jgi:hypothetical protein
MSPIKINGRGATTVHKRLRLKTPVKSPASIVSSSTSQTIVSTVLMSKAIVPARFENVVSMAYVVPSDPAGHIDRYIKQRGRNWIPIKNYENC